MSAELDDKPQKSTIEVMLRQYLEVNGGCHLGDDPNVEKSLEDMLRDHQKMVDGLHDEIKDYKRLFRVLGDLFKRLGSSGMDIKAAGDFIQAFKEDRVTVSPDPLANSALCSTDREYKDKQIEEAERHILNGDLRKARDCYADASLIDANDIRLLLRIGDISARMGEIGPAIMYYTTVVMWYEKHGFFLKAVAVYKQVLRFEPKNRQARECLIKLYERLGLSNEAEQQRELLAQYGTNNEDTKSSKP